MVGGYPLGCSFKNNGACVMLMAMHQISAELQEGQEHGFDVEFDQNWDKPFVITHVVSRFQWPCSSRGSMRRTLRGLVSVVKLGRKLRMGH